MVLPLGLAAVVPQDLLALEEANRSLHACDAEQQHQQWLAPHSTVKDCLKHYRAFCLCASGNLPLHRAVLVSRRQQCSPKGNGLAWQIINGK